MGFGTSHYGLFVIQKVQSVASHYFFGVVEIGIKCHNRDCWHDSQKFSLNSPFLPF